MVSGTIWGPVGFVGKLIWSLNQTASRWDQNSLAKAPTLPGESSELLDCQSVEVAAVVAMEASWRGLFLHPCTGMLPACSCPHMEASGLKALRRLSYWGRKSKQKLNKQQSKLLTGWAREILWICSLSSRKMHFVSIWQFMAWKNL